MPSAQIGGLQFLRIDPVTTAPGEEVENITRPGVDGVAYRKLGKRAVGQRLMALVDVADIAARLTLIQSASALRGTLITMYDNFGQAWTKMLVVRAEEHKTEPVRGAIGGIAGTAGTLLVTLEFELVDTRRSATEI